ncbi:15015_t:CDS:2, partial [Dentiscutata heterogama]
YDLMEIDNKKDSEPSDSEYDTAEEEPDIHFEKIIDFYINRITKAEKLNEGKVCDYYAFIPKGYYAENEPLGFFESIEEKIVNVYKRELALKGGLKIRIVFNAYMKKIKLEIPKPIYKTFPFKHETIEIIREDQINATIEKDIMKLKTRLRMKQYKNQDSHLFEQKNAYYTKEKAIKANKKLPHLNEIRRLRQNANIANFEGIKFPATLHDIDKFKESNPNYAINIFKPFYREAFRKIKVDIDPLHISEHNYQVEHMIVLLYLIEGEESLNDRKNQNDIPEGLKTHY